MESGVLKLLELVLIFGAVICWGFWELYQLRRDRCRARPRSSSDERGGRSSPEQVE